LDEFAERFHRQAEEAERRMDLLEELADELTPGDVDLAAAVEAAERRRGFQLVKRGDDA
jgi:hypothetical protein